MTPNLTAERLALVLLAHSISFEYASQMNGRNWSVIATAARTTVPTPSQRAEALLRVWKHQNEVADAA